MKYKNYYNYELGNRDIWSHNDVLGMPLKDIFANELPLSYQYLTIGIPKDDELTASPNTHQYSDANGKLRWRSSQKTTEELLEEERQRRQALESEQPQMLSQPQLKPIENLQQTLPLQPVENIQQEAQPLLDDDSIQAVSGLMANGIDKFLNRKKQGNKTILDSINDVVFSENQNQVDSPIMQEVENVLNKPSEIPFDKENSTPNYLEENIPQEFESGKFDMKTFMEQQKLPGYVDYIDYLSEDVPDYLLKGSVTKVENKNGVFDKLRNKVQDYLHDNSKLYRDYEGLTPIEAAQKWTSKFLSPLTAREYYGLASELKDDGKPAKKRLRDNDFYKLSDIRNEETKSLIQSNIIKNLGLNPNDPAIYDKIKDIDIVIPKRNSHLYNLVKDSDELGEFLANNYDYLSSNPNKRVDSSIEYARPRKSDFFHGFFYKVHKYAVYK